MPNWIITLIGVLVGGVLGFGFSRLNKHLDENKEEKEYLNDLLGDLEYNKKLANKRKGYGYHTLGYIDAKGAKYLFKLPKELKNQIYDAYSLIFYMNQKFDYPQGGGVLAERLEKLLERIIPEFKKYLKTKKLLNVVKTKS